MQIRSAVRHHTVNLFSLIVKPVPDDIRQSAILAEQHDRAPMRELRCVGVLAATGERIPVDENSFRIRIEGLSLVELSE